MPHHGLLSELEDDLERLVLNSGQSGGGQYTQQPMGYGQGMYAPAGMAYAPAVVGMPYQQQVYGAQPQVIGMGMQPQIMGMQPQMARQVYAPQVSTMGAQMPPYGQLPLVDGGNGQPAMIYGGGYEGVQQPRYQQSYAPQTGYQQSYANNAQPVQQGYAQPQQQQSYARGQSYAQQPQQGYAQVPQPPQQPQQGYAQVPQPPQQQPPQGYANNAQPAPQQQLPPPVYSQPSQPSQPSPQPAYQQQAPPPQQQAPPQQPAYQIAAQPSPQQAPPPVPQAAPQNTVQQVYVAPSPAPPVSQQGSQQGYAPPVSQSAPSPNQTRSTPQPYPSTSQPVPSLSYAPISQQVQQAPQANYIPAPQYASGYDARTSVVQREVPMQAPVQTYGLPTRPPAPVYTFLDPQQTMVRFEPTSHKADTHHHALKSLLATPNSPEALTAILGTYLAYKHSHESNHVFSVTGPYRHARPEIQIYNTTMDKLDSLSADFVSHHRSSKVKSTYSNTAAAGIPSEYAQALGPHRRHIFATLFNNSELVRGFSRELTDGPMHLPMLDIYALGSTLTSLTFAKSIRRAPMMNASYSLLSQVRTVVLLDDSGSMTEPGHSSWGFRSETRWQQARSLMAGLAPLIANHSPHGVDLHFLNRIPFYGGLRTSAAVQAAFDVDFPSNGTPTGQRLNDILDAYVCTLRHFRTLLPLNLIIITDGEAQDEHILHWTIEHHVTKMVQRGFPAHQFGIEFLQVGDCEFATRHLERLEEEVSRHHMRYQRDVVGVTPANRITRMDPETLLGIAVSGIDARMNGYMRSRGMNV